MMWSMSPCMENELIMSVLTGLLVLVGLAQVMMLINQKRQNQLALLQEYRNRWLQYRESWAIIVFIGRSEEEYYQVADESLLGLLIEMVGNTSSSAPTVWALESVNHVCSTLSDVCIKILQGQLTIEDVYPLFGSDLLRHSRPFRSILDVYFDMYATGYTNEDIIGSTKHLRIRHELQDWLIYHDGVRRRCLILIDLLWAEATRLEDLSPNDIECAAEAKVYTGKKSRVRLIREIRKINNLPSPFKLAKFTFFLKNSEFRKYKLPIGVDKSKLKVRDDEWSDMLLRRQKKP